jgi:chromosome partitioning protein
VSECRTIQGVIITLAGMKGGVAKTTSAIHLAAWLSTRGPTALIDGDPNQSATRWAARGSLPFPVIGVYKAASEARNFEHLVMDTKARPESDELRDLSEGCDLLVIPTTPDALALEGMMLTIEALQKLRAANYRVLLTIVPPDPIPEGREARRALGDAGVPVFDRAIRRLIAFQRAVSDGVTVDQVRDPRASLGALDYEYVGEQIERLVAASQRHSPAVS